MLHPDRTRWLLVHVAIVHPSAASVALHVQPLRLVCVRRSDVGGHRLQLQLHAYAAVMLALVDSTAAFVVLQMF